MDKTATDTIETVHHLEKEDPKVWKKNADTMLSPKEETNQTLRIIGLSAYCHLFLNCS